MYDYTDTVCLYYWIASKKELRIYAGQIDRSGYFRGYTIKTPFSVYDKEGQITKSKDNSNNNITNFWFWLRKDSDLSAIEIITNYIDSIIRDLEEAKTNALSVLIEDSSDTMK